MWIFVVWEPGPVGHHSNHERKSGDSAKKKSGKTPTMSVSSS